MLNFLNHKEKSYFPEKQLNMRFPKSLIAKAERVGEFHEQGKSFAYRHVEYVLFDTQDPTSAIILTSRVGRDFDNPVILSKNSDSPTRQEYTFVSDGQLYYIADDRESRKKDNSTIQLKDLMSSYLMENERNKCSVLKLMKQRGAFDKETAEEPTLNN